MRPRSGRLLAIAVVVVLFCCNGTTLAGYLYRLALPRQTVTAHVDDCRTSRGSAHSGPRTTCYASWRMPDGTRYDHRKIEGGSVLDEGHDITIDVVNGNATAVHSAHAVDSGILLTLVVIDGAALVVGAVALGRRLSRR